MQLRGHVRHKLKRLAADHANVLAPYNTLMYLFGERRDVHAAATGQPAIVRALNRTIGRSMIKAAATQNLPGEHVGVLNRVFEYVYKIRIVGTRIKACNRSAYYLLKWLLIGALLYVILV